MSRSKYMPLGARQFLLQPGWDKVWYSSFGAVSLLKGSTWQPVLGGGLYISLDNSDMDRFVREGICSEPVPVGRAWIASFDKERYKAAIRSKFGMPDGLIVLEAFAVNVDSSPQKQLPLSWIRDAVSHWKPSVSDENAIETALDQLVRDGLLVRHADATLSITLSGLGKLVEEGLH